MIALPPKFLTELEKADRHPFALLEIEGQGQAAEATTEAHWTANEDDNNVDFVSDPLPPAAGDVILAADAGGDETSEENGYPTSNIINQWDSGDYTDINNDSDASFLEETNTGTEDKKFIGALSLNSMLGEIPDNAHIFGINILARCYSEETASTIRIGYSDGTRRWSSSIELASGQAWNTYGNTWTTDVRSGEAWTKEGIAQLTEVGVSGYFFSSGPSYIRCSRLFMRVTFFDFLTSGYITVEFDLTADATITNQAVFSIDDKTPAGTGIVYTCEGSTSGAWGGEEVALGTITDASRVDGYRYYQVTATFAGTVLLTPVLKSIKVEIPDNFYRYSTLSDGTLNTLPLLKGIPGRTIKLSLKDFVTDSSAMSVNLVRNSSVDWMIRNEHFRGLHSTIRIGMYYPGVSDADLIPYYQGPVTNYTVGEASITINLKDATKDLSLKWPVVSAGTSKPSSVKDKVHMVQVIEDIIDDLGILSRYVDRSSLDIVRANVGDGSPLPELYLVKRTGDTAITQQEPGKDVIGELCEHLGAYLVIQENGKLKLIEYDSAATAVDAWDDNDIRRGASYTPGLESLRNNLYVYYDWVGVAQTGGGGDGIDFGSIVVAVDTSSPTSMVNWRLTSPKIIKSKWLSSDAGYYGAELATEIAGREIARLKDGVSVLSCTTSLDKAGVQVGDMVTIDSRVVINPDVGEESTRKFLVTSKTWDVGGGKVDWQLTEAR